MPIVRTFAPIVAGAGHMNYRKFIIYNIVGGALWTAGITYLGFFVGNALKAAGIDVDAIILPFVFIIILISVLPPAIHILKDKQRRVSIWNAVKTEFKSIFKRNK